VAKTKQRSSSASQRREEVKKHRQQRISNSQNRPPQSRNSGRGRSRQKQGPWGLIVGTLLVIAAIIGIFIYLSRQPASTGTGGGPTGPTPASSSVLNAVTHVSPTVLANVGTGGQQKILVSLQPASPTLLFGPRGKPEILYIGAEYCPYCAAQRWAAVVALSRFGTFSKLNQITSSATDVYPNTPTFTFYQSAYSSQYIDFVAVEETTNQPDGSGGYTSLQTPTADQQDLVSKYDAPPYLSSSGSIPFIDIGNRFVMQGANYSPDTLTGHSWQDIAQNLSNSDSPIAQGILGSANYLTAAICSATNQQPTSVCQADPVPQIEHTLNQLTFNRSGTQVGLLTPLNQAVIRRPD
jgi:thiol-disulfide isomerase/thioredoxin